jgi:hypothetical protein
MADPAGKVLVAFVLGTREVVDSVTPERALEIHRCGLRRAAFRQQARFCAVSLLVALANLAAGAELQGVVLSLLTFGLLETLACQLLARSQAKLAGVE